MQFVSVYLSTVYRREFSLSYRGDCCFVGRGGGIRTPDPLVPNQMRYQTALRPDFI
jgi:hypothetical protein